MVNLEDLLQQYPAELRLPQFYEFILKEYIQSKMLAAIAAADTENRLVFIGGTNLRIVHNNQRFSEDLDFDNFDLSRDHFYYLTDKVIAELQKSGYPAKAIDKKENPRLTAYRRNVQFPGLLQDLGLSGHAQKRFLIKIESEAHN